MECQSNIRGTTLRKTEQGTASFLSFDYIRFPIMPRLNYWMDGRPGKRTLFIEDAEETLLISFEEGMRCLDIPDTDTYRCAEYRQGSYYLHQKRPPQRANRRGCAYFHMEIPDETGEIWYLPGQMIVKETYVWAKGAEPILVEILNGIVLVKKGNCFAYS